MAIPGYDSEPTLAYREKECQNNCMLNQKFVAYAKN